MHDVTKTDYFQHQNQCVDSVKYPSVRPKVKCVKGETKYATLSEQFQNPIEKKEGGKINIVTNTYNTVHFPGLVHVF